MTGTNAITICDWKPLNKGALRGFFTVILPSGMRIHACTLFEKEERRWINGPTRSFTSNGKTTHETLVEFIDKSTADRFSAAVLAALDAYLGSNR